MPISDGYRVNPPDVQIAVSVTVCVCRSRLVGVFPVGPGAGRGPPCFGLGVNLPCPVGVVV
jgi:hypothetical protein